MKLALISLIIVSTAALTPAVQSSVNAKSNTALNAVSRRDVLGWIPAAAVATLPAVANAADKAGKTEKAKTEPAESAVISNFAGVYSDPKHPKGYRVIISDGKKSVHVAAGRPDRQSLLHPHQSQERRKTRNPPHHRFQREGRTKEYRRDRREEGQDILPRWKRLD